MKQLERAEVTASMDWHDGPSEVRAGFESSRA